VRASSGSFPTLRTTRTANVEQEKKNDETLDDDHEISVATETKKKRARIVSDNSSTNEDEASDESPDMTAIRINQQETQPHDSGDSPMDLERNSTGGNDDGEEHSGDEREQSGDDIDESNGKRKDSDEQRPNEDQEPSEGERSIGDHEGGEREGSVGNRSQRDEEAEEAPARKVHKKRVVKNPQPKLDATRLIGERGLGRLRNLYPHIRLKGKGHEHEDLKCILHNIQLWGHRMFPKMQMKDVLDRCARLGAKMPVRVHLRRMRTNDIQGFHKSESDENVQRGMDGDENLANNPVDEGVPFIDGEEQPPNGAKDCNDIFQELLDQRTDSGKREFAETREQDAPSDSSRQDDAILAKIRAKKLEAVEKRAQLRKEREAKRNEEELLEAQLTHEIEALS